MPYIRNCMTRNCQWISPNASLDDAAKIMRNYDIGFLPVGENDRLVGIVTDRDIVVRALAEDKDSAKTRVRDIMSSHVFYCYDDETAEEVCRGMAGLQIHRMPVVDRDKNLVGAISFGDLAQFANVVSVGRTVQQITYPYAQPRAA